MHCMGPPSHIAMAQAEQSCSWEGDGAGAAMAVIVKTAKRRPMMPIFLRIVRFEWVFVD